PGVHEGLPRQLAHVVRRPERLRVVAEDDDVVIAPCETFGERVSGAFNATAFLPLEGQAVAEHREAQTWSLRQWTRRLRLRRAPGGCGASDETRRTTLRDDGGQRRRDGPAVPDRSRVASAHQPAPSNHLGM